MDETSIEEKRDEQVEKEKKGEDNMNGTEMGNRDREGRGWEIKEEITWVLNK